MSYKEKLKEKLEKWSQKNFYCDSKTLYEQIILIIKRFNRYMFLLAEIACLLMIVWIVFQETTNKTIPHMALLFMGTIIIGGIESLVSKTKKAIVHIPIAFIFITFLIFLFISFF